MRAGNLRERVTVQRRGSGSDGMGNVTTAFADVSGAVNIPAQIRPVRAGESGFNQGVRPIGVFEISVRRTATLEGVQVGDRVLNVRTNAVYAVTGPPMNPDQRGRELLILVEQGGADG